MTMPSYVINWEDLGDVLSMEEVQTLIGSLRDLGGGVSVQGAAQSIPAMYGEYVVLEWQAEEKTAIMGLSYAQSSYSSKDYWELWINGDRVFETVYVGELGCTKHWEVVHYIKPNDVVRVVHTNDSASSKDVWVDLEFSGGGNLREINKYNWSDLK